MKERPILFNGEMVQAILEGRKTQTRRVIDPQPKVTKEFLRKNGAWVDGLTLSQHVDQAWQDGFIREDCPYGSQGDRLLVQESFWIEITGVRIERLHDISEADAIAEGVVQEQISPILKRAARSEFMQLWASIYGWDSCESNPFVWVIEFKKIESE